MKPIKLIRISDADEKSRIVADVLDTLGEWFGLPDSTQAYIEESRELPFWAAGEGGMAHGFVTLKTTARYAAEVHCMGVRPNLHRQGIGRALMEAFDQHALTEGYRYAQVKTVDQGHYPAYDRTIAFYEAMGFTHLEAFPNLWDAWNPYLLLVKGLHPAAPVP